MTIHSASTAGEFLKKLRISQLKIQGEVADACGKTVSYWSALENGKKPVTPSVIEFCINYFSLDTKNAERLTTLAALQAKKEQKIELADVDDDAKELAVAFAMHLKNLNKNQISRIQKIISQKKEDDPHE